MKSFIKYIVCKLKQESNLIQYRSYIADSLQAIGRNTAKFGGGGYIKKRYIEIYNETNKPKSSKNIKVNSEQVLANLIAKGGIKIKKKAKKAREEENNELI